MNCSNPLTPLELSDLFQIHRATGPEHMLRHIYEGSAMCQAPLAHRICESWKASEHCGYFLYFPNDTTKAQAGYVTGLTEVTQVPRGRGGTGILGQVMQAHVTTFQSSPSSPSTGVLTSRFLHTSSGSESLNSQPSPVQLIKD